MSRTFLLLCSLFALLLLLSGCAAPVQILTPATQPLSPYKTLEITPLRNDVVGKIDRSVIDDIMQDAVEGILDLRYFDRVIVSDQIPLKKEISDKVLRPSMFKDSAAAVARLKTTITEFDEGSATLRFFFGALAGSGQVTLELTVADGKTDNLLLKGKTTSKISGAFASASNVVGPLSKAIVNFTEDHFVKK